jgi:hypothetical protein
MFEMFSLPTAQEFSPLAVLLSPNEDAATPEDVLYRPCAVA